MLIVFKTETFLITLRPQYILFCPSERYYTGYIECILIRLLVHSLPYFMCVISDTICRLSCPRLMLFTVYDPYLDDSYVGSADMDGQNVKRLIDTTTGSYVQEPDGIAIDYIRTICEKHMTF